MCKYISHEVIWELRNFDSHFVCDLACMYLWCSLPSRVLRSFCLKWSWWRLQMWELQATVEEWSGVWVWQLLLLVTPKFFSLMNRYVLCLRWPRLESVMASIPVILLLKLSTLSVVHWWSTWLKIHWELDLPRNLLHLLLSKFIALHINIPHSLFQEYQTSIISFVLSC